MMKRIMKWLGIGVGSIAGLGVMAFAALWAVSSSRMNETYEVATSSLTIPSDAESVAHGRHIARAVAKCMDCHGDDLSGKTMMDDPMLGRIVADNITPAGVTGTYTDEDWVRAIRHGVRPDGRSVVVMPSYEFQHLDDEDLTALIAYLKTVEPAESELETMRFGPLGRFLIATDAFPVLSATAIDHDAPRPAPIERAPTPAYGKYLASIGCVGCHGPALTGGKPPAPPAPDITKAGRVGEWTPDQFRTALRAGLRPDGTVMSTEMPWIRTSELTDLEIDALYAYLQSLEPATAVAEAGR